MANRVDAAALLPEPTRLAFFLYRPQFPDGITCTIIPLVALHLLAATRVCHLCNSTWSDRTMHVYMC